MIANSVRLCSWRITDDNLWRPTRRAEEHYTKDKLSTRRGAVHSIGWLCTLVRTAELLDKMRLGKTLGKLAGGQILKAGTDSPG